MSVIFGDTIAAIATPPGKGGIAIIRISGPEVKSISMKILGSVPKPRQASFTRFLMDSEIIDEGLAIYFPGPGSFTGEDILELHGHGGAIVSDRVLNAVLQAGARMARPGEFSERAFLNEKIDLAQAEAVVDLIEASSVQSARAAMRTLEGVFSNRINSLLAELIELRVYVESSLDFSDEEIDLLESGDIENRLKNLQAKIQELVTGTQRGSVLSEGLNVVLAGKPNAGKSSLMNILCGRESAIVTSIPGTTRDVLRERISIDGIPVTLHDTAGLRADAEVIEQEGIRRAKTTIDMADLILWIHDDRDPLNDEEINTIPQDRLVLVHNKIDRSGNTPGIYKDDRVSIRLSALTGQGINHLREYIVEYSGLQVTGENEFSARRRHIKALQGAAVFVDNALVQLTQQLSSFGTGELVAEELRLAQDNLGEITGRFTSDDLLGKIFSEFCIGK